MKDKYSKIIFKTESDIRREAIEGTLKKYNKKLIDLQKKKEK